jgi:predicted ester cyclase
MTETEPIADIVKRAFQALESNDFISLEAIMPPDMAANTRRYWDMTRLASPDLRVAIEDQITQGEKVVTRWIATGTHSGSAELPGFGFVKPTGKRLAVQGITIHRVVNGAIADVWSVMEQLDSPYCQIEALLHSGIISDPGS